MRTALRILLIALAAFVAVSAIPSAFLVVPTMPMEWMRAGPFTDWTIPAIALFGVGVLHAVTAIALVVRPSAGALLSVAAGAAMVIFELVEVAVVGWTLTEFGTDQPQAWLQLVYLVIGAAQVVAGGILVAMTRDQVAPGARPTELTA